MSQLPQSLINIQETIVSAVGKLGGSTGVSLENIQQHLSTVLDKVPDSESIKSYLNDAVDKGFLKKLDDGKYKMNEYINSAKEGSQNTMSSAAKNNPSDLDSGKDKIKEYAKNAKEYSQNTMSSVAEKMPSDLDSGKDKIKEYAKNAKEYSQSTMSSAAEKMPSDLDSGKDKIKEYAKNAKEVAKDAKNSFEKEFYAMQGKEKSKETEARTADENMNSESGQGNVNSSAEEQYNTTARKFAKKDK